MKKFFSVSIQNNGDFFDKMRYKFKKWNIIKFSKCFINLLKIYIILIQ